MKQTTNKLMKKAMGLKGFLNSMSMKKGQDGFVKKDSGEPISFNYKSKYRGDKQILKGTSPEGNYKTKKVSEFMSPGIEGGYFGPSTVKETARRTMKGMLKGAEKPVKSSMKKGGTFPDLTGDGKVTRADILKGRGVFKKGGMSKMANEAFNNAKRTITDGYKGTGAPNPLRSILKKNKYAMGGDFFPQNPLTASKYKGDTLMGQSFKKGGMTKKKKK